MGFRFAIMVTEPVLGAHCSDGDDTMGNLWLNAGGVQ